MNEKLIYNAMATAESNAKSVMNNLYIDDKGFYCCKNCHTRKQVEIFVFGRSQRVYCDCKCEQEQYKKEREEYYKQKKITELEEYKRYGFSNDDYNSYSFGQDDCSYSKESQISRKYVKNFEQMKKSNLGLLFHGACDTGKTFYSACICNELAKQGYFVIMTSISALSEKMDANFKAERSTILERISQADLLILDDVGTERKTHSALENAFDIVNARYLSKKPMIISTNLKPKELGTEDIRLERIYQRILSGTKKVECTIPSHRKSFTSNQKEALEILESV